MKRHFGINRTPPRPTPLPAGRVAAFVIFVAFAAASVMAVLTSAGWLK